MTLEQFIKNYTGSQAKKGELGYADYLKTYENDPYGSYTDTLDTLAADYRRATSDYGAQAEALSSRGLLGSGYAAYLDGNAYAAMQEGKQRARNTLADQLSLGAARYDDYRQSATEKTIEKLRQVHTDILDKKITDPDAAYAYAVGQGLTEKEAQAIAEAGSTLAIEKHQQTLLNLIVEQNMDAERAIAVGLYYGLPRDKITELAHFASILNQNAPSPVPPTDFYEQYMDYIKTLK